jgi:hypothetical protein
MAVDVCCRDKASMRGYMFRARRVACHTFRRRCQVRHWEWSGTDPAEIATEHVEARTPSKPAQSIQRCTISRSPLKQQQSQLSCTPQG